MTGAMILGIIVLCAVAFVSYLIGLVRGDKEMWNSITRTGVYEFGNRRIVGKAETKEWPK